MIRRRAQAGLAVVGLLLGACSDGGSSGSTAGSTSGSTTTAAAGSDQRWAGIDRDLAKLGPRVGFLAARVADDGTCEPIHEVAPSTARPTASQFKLFVLGALAEQIAVGDVAWDDDLTITERVKSLGNGAGSLQELPAGTEVSVEDAATRMISISDNTATDMLIELVGRDAVEEQAAAWTGDAAANTPFLMTREMFLLHYVKGLGDHWLATPASERAHFLATEVTPRPRGDIGSGYSTDPRFVDRIEWFAGPDDICRSFAGLQELAGDPALKAALPKVLSKEDGTLDLDPAEWPTVWFKGGSEAGVLTLGWLATNEAGETYVVETMVSNPDEPLADASITDLVTISERAFELIG